MDLNHCKRYCVPLSNHSTTRPFIQEGKPMKFAHFVISTNSNNCDCRHVQNRNEDITCYLYRLFFLFQA